MFNQLVLSKVRHSNLTRLSHFLDLTKKTKSYQKNHLYRRYTTTLEEHEEELDNNVEVEDLEMDQLEEIDELDQIVPLNEVNKKRNFFVKEDTFGQINNEFLQSIFFDVPEGKVFGNDAEWVCAEIRKHGKEWTPTEEELYAVLSWCSNIYKVPDRIKVYCAMIDAGAVPTEKIFDVGLFIDDIWDDSDSEGLLIALLDNFVRNGLFPPEHWLSPKIIEAKEDLHHRNTFLKILWIADNFPKECHWDIKFWNNLISYFKNVGDSYYIEEIHRIMTAGGYKFDTKLMNIFLSTAAYMEELNMGINLFEQMKAKRIRRDSRSHHLLRKIFQNYEEFLAQVDKDQEEMEKYRGYYSVKERKEMFGEDEGFSSFGGFMSKGKQKK